MRGTRGRGTRDMLVRLPVGWFGWVDLVMRCRNFGGRLGRSSMYCTTRATPTPACAGARQ